MHVISINPEGRARCLWSDALHLGDLGRATVERASEIEYNNERQSWEVREPFTVCDDAGTREMYRVLFRHANRAECLAWERDYFSRQLMEGTH